MRKGKGKLTYRQLEKRNKFLRKCMLMLQRDYNSLKIAHNKLLKEASHGKCD